MPAGPITAGEIVHPDGRHELKDAGEIMNGPLANQDPGPVPISKRTWTTYNYAALWIGMAHNIPSYTQALIAAVPRLDPGLHRLEVAVRSEPPSPFQVPTACRFHTRCPLAQVPELCAEEAARLKAGTNGSLDHRAACHFPWSPPARLQDR